MTARRRRVGLAAAIAAGGLLAGAAARAAVPPPPSGEAWQAWREAVSRQFAHARVTFGEIGRPFLAGGRNGCPVGPFRRPGLWAGVRSPNRKLFGDIEIQIFQLEEKADGYAFLKESLHAWPDDRLGPSSIADPTEHCAAVGNTTVSFIQSGRYWLIILGHCADAALYRYEVGEVLEMVRQKEPAETPTTFAFSGCGQNTPQFVPVEELLEKLKKRASYWGRSFPEEREAARKKLAHR